MNTRFAQAHMTLLALAALLTLGLTACGDKPDFNWQRPPDKPDGCLLECEYGYQSDGNGGLLCACKAPVTCNCGDVYDPVCGEDGVTYANACVAQCLEINIASLAECEDTTCPSMDTCKLNCAHGFIQDNRGCDTCDCYQCAAIDCDLFCPNGYKTDDRACAICACADCVCPEEYDPVCGKDNVTYPNACQAACAGAEVAYSGTCGTPETCVTDSDCDAGFSCQNGRCKPVEVSCGDTQCLVGQVCETCPFNPECPFCESCPAPVCVSADDGCSLHDINGKCVCFAINYIAAGYSNCPEGYSCDYSGEGNYWGYCQPDNPVPVCGEIGGVCVGLYPGYNCPQGYTPANGRAQCPGDGAVCCLPCDCDDVMDPVCGTNGITYNNQCLAECAGVSVAYRGDCHSLMCVSDSGCPQGYRCENGQCVSNGEQCGNNVCTENQRCEACPVDPNCLYCDYCPEDICVPNNDGCYRHDMYGQCICFGYYDMEYCPAGTQCQIVDEQTGFGYCKSLNACVSAGGMCIPVVPGAACPSGYGPSQDSTVTCGGLGSTCCLPCNCYEEYDPVCGADGLTYQNACYADCAQVAVAYRGSCRQVQCNADADCLSGFICENAVCVLGERCWDGTLCLGEMRCENCPSDPNCPMCAYCPPSVCVNKYDGCTRHDMYGQCMCYSDDECPAGMACNYVDDSFGWGYCGTPVSYLCESNFGGACYSYACPPGYEPLNVDIDAEGSVALCPGNELCCVRSSDPCSSCPRTYDPVCGVNGQTYDNYCFAQCQGMAIAYWGQCQSNTCTTDRDCPVGAICVNGVCKEGACLSDRDCSEPQICEGGMCTYLYCNSSADCPTGQTCLDGICQYQTSKYCEELYPGGFCTFYSPDGSICPDGYQTVWTEDGSLCPSTDMVCCAPDDPCGCTQDWDPVCGFDGQTYINECAARCRGMDIAYWGECQVTGECMDDSMCAAGFWCQINPCFVPPCYGTCVPYDQENPSCTDSGQCGDGAACIDSHCADPETCPLYSQRTGSCSCGSYIGETCPDNYYCQIEICYLGDICYGSCIYSGYYIK